MIVIQVNSMIADDLSTKLQSLEWLTVSKPGNHRLDEDSNIRIENAECSS